MQIIIKYSKKDWISYYKGQTRGLTALLERLLAWEPFVPLLRLLGWITLVDVSEEKVCVRQIGKALYTSSLTFFHWWYKGQILCHHYVCRLHNGMQNTTTIKILYSFHSGYGSPGTIPSNSIVLGVVWIFIVNWIKHILKKGENKIWI